MYPSAVPVPRQSDQDVAMATGHVGGVDPEVPGYGRGRPTPRERLPGSIQSLHGKVSKIRLKQLANVVAELHVKVALEDGIVGYLS